MRIGPFEVRPAEVGPFEVRVGEDGPFEVRLGEVGPFEVRVGEVGPFEVRAREDGLFEVRPGEAGPFEVRVGEVGPFEVAAFPRLKYEPPQICTSEVEAVVLSILGDVSTREDVHRGLDIGCEWRAPDIVWRSRLVVLPLLARRRGS